MKPNSALPPMAIHATDTLSEIPAMLYGDAIYPRVNLSALYYQERSTLQPSPYGLAQLMLVLPSSSRRALLSLTTEREYAYALHLRYADESMWQHLRIPSQRCLISLLRVIQSCTISLRPSQIYCGATFSSRARSTITDR
jgi:hypothetical protein